MRQQAACGEALCGAVEFRDLHPRQDDLRSEVLAGLQSVPKTLPPKLFYDETGSQLFNRICELQEYYLTRAEYALFAEHIAEISQLFSQDCALIEYGCGSSKKVRMLLDAAAGCRAYVGVDISKEALLELTTELSESYPNLSVMALCADFLNPFHLPLERGALKKIAFFPGSSIGNFDPDEAILFLQNVARAVGEGGGLLIGVDLKKDPKRLDAAYNDGEGVTAKFNKNILARINRDCGSNFNLSNFEHYAFYNGEAGRVEMHLRSAADQKVSVGRTEIAFAKGETIHTENSYKYSVKEFQALAARAGWVAKKVWMDRSRLMSLHYFEVASGFAMPE